MRRGWTTRTGVRHRLAITGTLIGLAITATLSGASITQAKDGTAYVDGGYARFQDYGDQFTVCDTKADGHPVVGFIAKEGSDSKAVWATGGAGTCEPRNYNYREGTHLIISVCVPGVRCGSPVEVIA